MQLDVFSDTICPWCYVGKRRLERALKARPQQGLTIRWRAFQLNPGMPADGMDRRAYVEAKFGNPERAQAIYETVRSAGQSEGIAFAFERIKRTLVCPPAVLIWIRTVIDVWRERAKVLLVDMARSTERKREKRPSVKCSIERNHCRAPGVCPRNLDRVLHRLCTGVQ